MRLFEKIMIGVVIVSLIVNGFTDLKLALPVLILSLFLIALFNFLFGCVIYNDISFKKIFDKTAYEGISPIRLTTTIAFGLIIGFEVLFLLFGVLNKVNHNSGASYLIFGSSGLMLITALISLLLRKKHFVFKSFFERSIIMFGLSILIAAIVFFETKSEPVKAFEFLSCIL